MAVASSIGYFIIALSILIAVHEWGHFIVARLLGVKVLRFAIGFGKPIFSYKGKKGTEYRIGIFPLGGYVKMLDEEEGDVPPELKHQAFNRKPVWARMAVVVAGPVLNIIFAVLALWLMFVIGIKSMAPIVGKVEKGSIAQQAGIVSQDEIIDADGKPVRSWRDFQIAMMAAMGTENSMTLSIYNKKSQQTRQARLALNNWQIDPDQPDVLKSLGIKPYVPLLKPIIGELMPSTPAFDSGLKTGDVVTEINGEPIKYWHQLMLAVQKNGIKPITFAVKRHQQLEHFTITPMTKEVNGQNVSFVGIMVKPQYIADNWIRKQQYSVSQSLVMAVSETKALIEVSLQMIAKFITGKVSLRNIGGPIGVAQGASQSAQIGLAYYLSFLALVSVSLGVLNILPVPMLDGGHLLFYTAELLFRRPLPKVVQEKLMVVGLAFLMGLTALAVFNDMSRLMH